ncbi:MAG: hypothetical protein K2L87_04105 [Clostridiales bacterium]|nr:hypothetical protein [Clostridiales bacterium]
MNALLEREIEETAVETQVEARPVDTTAEDLHAQRMHENFKRLLGEASAEPVSASAATETLEREPEIAPVPDAAERIASFTRVEPLEKTNRRTLFENVTYKDGKLSGLETSAPVYEVVNAHVETPYMAAAAEEAETEDSLPTRRTMETLRRDAQKFEHTSAMAAISAKTKVVLATLALVIIMAITIICINTSLLSTLSADIASLETQAATLRAQASELQMNIEEITSEESIVEWAIENGMVRS